MSTPIDSLLLAFEKLTLEQQRLLVEKLQRRYTDRLEQVPTNLAEIEVIGGYDQTYDDQSTIIPLPEDVVYSLRRFTCREQIENYLKNLPDEEILWRWRFLQFRYLPDGTLWQVFAHAHVHREVSNATRLEESHLQRFSCDQRLTDS